MDGDVIFLIGMALFYLLQRVSKKNKRRPAPTVRENNTLSAPLPVENQRNPQRLPEPESVPDHYVVNEESTTEDSLVEKDKAKALSADPSLARLLGQLLGEQQGQFTPQEEDASAWRSEESFESATPVGSSDDRFSDTAGSEWHEQKTQNDWTDETSDFDFHAAHEKQRTPHDSHRERSFVKRRTELVSKRSERTKNEQSTSGPVKIPRGLSVGARLSDKASLKEAIILQLVLGPPVSLRTRPARRHLS